VGPACAPACATLQLLAALGVLLAAANGRGLRQTWQGQNRRVTPNAVCIAADAVMLKCLLEALQTNNSDVYVQLTLQQRCLLYLPESAKPACCGHLQRAMYQSAKHINT
jgi:hypothetical protein